MTVDQLEQEALKLSPSQRARLAKLLIASLDDGAESDQEWLAEAQRRDEELDSGEVAGTPAEVVRERGRSHFGQ